MSVPAYFPVNYFPGLNQGGGGSCDYPIENNVRLGIIYGFGTMVGNIVLPIQSNVRKPIGYGANGTELIGTLKVPAPVVPSSQVANQGISLWDMILSLQQYLMLTTGLPERLVKVWFGPTRPAIEGKDMFVWFRPQVEQPSKSLGPGRWGNRSDVKFDLHLITRNFADSSQVDMRRAQPFYDTYWKMEQALQGKNLFTNYVAPVIVDSIWHPPAPDGDATPLTIEPMYLNDLPVPDKTQKEEGSLEAGFVVICPIVLALTVP